MTTILGNAPALRHNRNQMKWSKDQNNTPEQSAAVSFSCHYCQKCLHGHAVWRGKMSWPGNPEVLWSHQLTFKQMNASGSLFSFKFWCRLGRETGQATAPRKRKHLSPDPCGESWGPVCAKTKPYLTSIFLV